MLYNFGELRGIKGLKKSRRLEISPFILGDLKTMEAESGIRLQKMQDMGRQCRT